MRRGAPVVVPSSSVFTNDRCLFICFSGVQPELVFHHVVGASRESNTVSTLLLRIVSELKAYFGLQMAVSTQEGRLSWELVRAIEASARKGRVILVIDGVERLQSRLFAHLKWLPLFLPANVRMVLSCSVPADNLQWVVSGGLSPSGTLTSNTRALSSKNDGAGTTGALTATASAAGAGAGAGGVGDSTDLTALDAPDSFADSESTAGAAQLTDKNLIELSRRGLSAMVLRYLASHERRVVVQALLAKHGATADSADAPAGVSTTPVTAQAQSSMESSLGGYTPITSVASDEDNYDDDDYDNDDDDGRGSGGGGGGSGKSDGGSDPATPRGDGAAGRTLSLTPEQLDAIIAAPCAPSPLFLRLVVDSLALAFSKGMDVAILLPYFVQCRSVRELLQRVLKQWTRGWLPTAASDMSGPSAGASRHPLASPLGNSKRAAALVPIGPVSAKCVSCEVVDGGAVHLDTLWCLLFLCCRSAQSEVQGLGPALGGALAFVFASRSGMSLTELQDVLKKEVSALPVSGASAPDSVGSLIWCVSC